MVLNYRHDIDGLRAVAVMAVVLFHAGLWPPGGYVGVDVFFVISGFLITSLIVADLEQGTFSVVRFWERRIRRIWPAAIVVVAATLIAGWWLTFPRDYRATANDAVAHVLMLANVRFWLKTDYFADQADLFPLLHLWSLAVEEQFYVLLPPILIAVGSRGRSFRMAVVAALAVGSLAASQWAVVSCPSAAFYLLPFRAWELLAGSLLALSAQPNARWQRECLGAGGAIAIFGAYALYDHLTPFPGLFAVVPCAGAAAVIAAGAHSGSVVSRALAIRPLVIVGQMSYSIYLWHWPLLASLRYSLSPKPSPVALGMYCAALAAASYLSWQWIELPLRFATKPPWRSRALAGTLAASFLVLACATLVGVAKGFPSRFPQATLRLLNQEAVCEKWEMKPPSAFEPKPIGADSSEISPCFLLWGDSHGMAISPVVDSVAREFGISGVTALARGQIPAVARSNHAGHHSGDVIAWNDKVSAWIAEHRPRHVIICARWSMFFGLVQDGHRAVDVAPYTTASRAGWPARKAELRSAIDWLIRDCDAIGAELWVLLEVPYQSRTARERVVEAYWSGREPSSRGVDRLGHEERALPVRDVFAGIESPTVHVIDLAEPFFDADGASFVRAGGKWLYADDDHLCPAGADLILRPTVQNILRRIGADCDRQAGPSALHESSPGHVRARR